MPDGGCFFFFLVLPAVIFSHPKLFLVMHLSAVLPVALNKCLDLHTGTPSAITGMCGAISGRQSAAVKPHLYIYIYIFVIAENIVITDSVPIPPSSSIITQRLDDGDHEKAQTHTLLDMGPVLGFHVASLSLVSVTRASPHRYFSATHKLIPIL